MCTFVSVIRDASNLGFHSFHVLIHLEESFLPAPPLLLNLKLKMQY